MSNPAVILLSKNHKGKNKFHIEDNIGESIHLHYDDFRIDLTTKEFLNFDAIIKKSLEELIDIKNFELKYFDLSFIKSISEFLPDLEKVSFENVDISKLIIQRRGFLGLPVLSSINQSRVLQALKGDEVENRSYDQINRFNKTNEQRVNDVYQLITDKGYPYDNQYIVLFNHQYVIRDGQHRASSLIHSGVTGNIPVIKMYFKNDEHNIAKRPWLILLYRAIASLFIKLAGKAYRILKRFIIIKN